MGCGCGGGGVWGVGGLHICEWVSGDLCSWAIDRYSLFVGKGTKWNRMVLSTNQTSTLDYKIPYHVSVCVCVCVCVVCVCVCMWVCVCAYLKGLLDMHAGPSVPVCLSVFLLVCFSVCVFLTACRFCLSILSVGLFSFLWSPWVFTTTI